MICSGLQCLPAAEVLRSELRDSEGLDALSDPWGAVRFDFSKDYLEH